MNDDRRSILDLLAKGQITADEAERLLSALDRGAQRSASAAPGSNGAPRYLRVTVDSDEPGEGPTKVNVRVPISLLRAGVRLSSVLPPEARVHVNAAMAEHGVNLDLNQFKPENLEALIDQLGELTVDVDQERTKVRVYCE